jgi:hypothetical protein
VSYNFLRRNPWLTESFHPDFRPGNRANPYPCLHLSAAAKLPLFTISAIRSGSLAPQENNGLTRQLRGGSNQVLWVGEGIAIWEEGS